MPTPSPEIVAAIIANVALEGDKRTRTRALHACCQVSRAFFHPAQAVLYSHLQVQLYERETAPDEHVINYSNVDPDTAEEEACVRTDSRALELTLLTHPRLGQLVRSLRVKSSVEDYQVSRPRSPSFVIAIILRCCPNLEDIRILEQGHSGLAESLDVIRCLRPTLKRLSIQSWNSFDSATREALAGFTKLDHLDIGTTSTSAERILSQEGDNPVRFRLKSLIIYGESGTSTPEMFSYFAQSSASSLKTMSLALDTFNLDLSPFANLDTVTFILQRQYQGLSVADGMASCLRRAGPRVRHLTIAIARGGDHVYQSTLVIDFLYLLPPSITSLDISSYSIPDTILVAFLRPSVSPGLRRLVVCGVDCDDSTPVDMSEVVEAGAARGVVVEVTRRRITK